MEEKESIRKELKCNIHPVGFLGTYKYVVVCSYYKGQWLLSRHVKRDTWETQGGHVEPGETPLEAAKRELYEESGVQDAKVYPVCDYYGYNSKSHANGMVFLAKIHSFGELPESEMKETRLFAKLPGDLTYPDVTPVLIGEAEKFMRAQCCVRVGKSDRNSLKRKDFIEKERRKYDYKAGND